MTKSELIDAVYSAASEKKIGLTKKSTAELIDVLFETVTKAIKDDKRFSYPNFGTFTVKERKARQGRNPKNKEIITIEASKSVAFKPAPEFKKNLD